MMELRVQSSQPKKFAQDAFGAKGPEELKTFEMRAAKLYWDL